MASTKFMGAWLFRQKITIYGTFTNQIAMHKMHMLSLVGDNVPKYLNEFDGLMMELKARRHL